MRNRTIAYGLLLAGSATFVGFTRAAAPAIAPASGGHDVVAMAEDKNKEVSEGEHLQHLREARRYLNMAKDAFDADKPERGNRAMELQHIDKAIDTIDDEIKMAEEKMKK